MLVRINSNNSLSQIDQKSLKIRLTIKTKYFSTKLYWNYRDEQTADSLMYTLTSGLAWELSVAVTLFQSAIAVAEPLVFTTMSEVGHPFIFGGSLSTTLIVKLQAQQRVDWIKKMSQIWSF